MVSFNQLLAAQQLYQAQLLAKSNVVGVAIGYKDMKGENTGDLAIVALVERKLPRAALTDDDLIPQEFEGARTDVLEIGYVRAQTSPPLSPRDRWRPIIPAGVSIGHYLVTAGTLGAVVQDANTGEMMLLSNNHVFANANDAFIGDPILQPAATDKGLNPGDVVAKLERYQALRYHGDPITQPPPPVTPPPGNGGIEQPPTTPRPTSTCDITEVIIAFGNLLARLNGSDKRLVATSVSATAQTAPTIQAQTTIPENRLDAALAKPITPAMFSNEILNIGRISGIAAPQLGMQVRKSGRTTGTTQGMITQLNATIDVGYHTLAGPRTARFIGQVITTGISQGGDSGSLVVDANSQNALGLLFAGSGTASIFTPMQVVLDEMQIRF